MSDVGVGGLIWFKKFLKVMFKIMYTPIMTPAISSEF